MDLEKLLPLLLFAGWSIISVIVGKNKEQKTPKNTNESHEKDEESVSINVFENLKQYAQQFSEKFTQEAIVELPQEEKNDTKNLTKIESVEKDKKTEQKSDIINSPVILQKKIKKRKQNIISSKKDLAKAVILSEIILPPISIRNEI